MGSTGQCAFHGCDSIYIICTSSFLCAKAIKQEEFLCQLQSAQALITSLNIVQCMQNHVIWICFFPNQTSKYLIMLVKLLVGVHAECAY